jgi:hypothetical protein
VANKFPLAAVNRGNIQQNVSAYEADSGNGTMNTDYVIEDVGDRQYCNGVDVTNRLRKYNPDEWSRLLYELKGEIYQRKRERGSAGSRSRGCGRGQGCCGSSVASLTSQIQAMQASIAALATGTDDMSTLTDILVPVTQTPPSPTDQSTTSELGKQKAPTIGPPVGGLKRNNHGGSISHIPIGNIQPSTGAWLLSSPVSVNALEMRSHTVG